MKTNKEILENGYWSSSSGSSSIRSEFDDEYYRMKPPTPKFEDYLEKIVVIKEGQFSQSEAKLQNAILPNKSKIQNNVQQKRNNKNLVASSFKSEATVNGQKAPDRQRFKRSVHTNITNGNNVSHKLNHSYNESKVNTTAQDQSLTINENFRRGPNYVAPFTKKNANENNAKPHQYPTPSSSITKSNEVEKILSQRMDQTTLYSINSADIEEDTWQERIKPLPSQDTTTRYQRGITTSRNVPLPKPSTSTTSSITGRCNTLSRKVDTASGKSKLHSSNNSKTYNTFLAVQPTASRNNTIQIHQPTSRNNTIQIHQPTSSNPVERNKAVTTENTNETCFNICCCCFNCCS